MSKIAIVGLQHQGVIQAVCFSEIGHGVMGIDDSEDTDRVAKLNAAHYHGVHEPELENLMEKALKQGLVFTTSFDAIRYADFVFLSIDVTFNKDGLMMEPILATAAKIEALRSPESILCVCTQVPVGTTETLTKGKVAYLPELLRPGQSLLNFLRPDRIIIGSEDPEVLTKVVDLYSSLGRPIFKMNLRSAEMSKHVHNAILATQISFVNEMEKICKAVGANIHDVAAATKADSRVGQNSYLNPGWSLRGGHVIRDVRVLRQLNVPTPLMDAVIAVDDNLES